MKNFFESIVAPLVVAGIVANVAIWFRIESKFSTQGERLARIETKLENIQSEKTNLAQKNYVNTP